jgi:hypothetical protein
MNKNPPLLKKAIFGGLMEIYTVLKYRGPLFSNSHIGTRRASNANLVWLFLELLSFFGAKAGRTIDFILLGLKMAAV